MYRLGGGGIHIKLTEAQAIYERSSTQIDCKEMKLDIYISGDVVDAELYDKQAPEGVTLFAVVQGLRKRFKLPAEEEK